MGKVVDQSFDAPPSTLDEDVSVKDELAVQPSDEPPSFLIEDLPVQDEVVDRLSYGLPSIELACDQVRCSFKI